MNLLTRQEPLKLTLEGKNVLLELPINYEGCTWSVFDLSGSEKLTGSLIAPLPFRIDVGPLPKGIYQICVMSDGLLHCARVTLN